MKKFIITDPCYIIANHIWGGICTELDSQPFPIQITGQQGQDFILHWAGNTGSGDGGYTHKGEKIGVDSGMLCIAEAMGDNDWSAEHLGAHFDTLREAEKVLVKVLKSFEC